MVHHLWGMFFSLHFCIPGISEFITNELVLGSKSYLKSGTLNTAAEPNVPDGT